MFHLQISMGETWHGISFFWRKRRRGMGEKVFVYMSRLKTKNCFPFLLALSLVFFQLELAARTHLNDALLESQLTTHVFPFLAQTLQSMKSNKKWRGIKSIQYYCMRPWSGTSAYGECKTQLPVVFFMPCISHHGRCYTPTIPVHACCVEWAARSRRTSSFTEMRSCPSRNESKGNDRERESEKRHLRIP